ncbi:SWIM zinc finger family protein, partial [Nonomuraea lactucae]|uniref:SWIM zinc finger family protein n=1 Tax=Nonomuraea lactucae TaxID=2249762 RepID=UPI001965D591
MTTTRANDPADTAAPAGGPTAGLPPVAPNVVAAAVEALTSRLRKKLDAAIEQYAARPVAVGGEGIEISCGEDALVTLTPGESGAIVEEGQARCSCLLAPRCLHRAAVLSACPLADQVADTAPSGPVVDVGGGHGPGGDAAADPASARGGDAAADPASAAGGGAAADPGAAGGVGAGAAG